ncbi:MAG TPA: CoA transferase [Stellaceae bacterium]|jgi:crotonobetainyl-CoA:carnitine CoA-transferase CaiB-like acyl-CoA transferase|nr:CoA transferase [Stellaceae bacterium]
MMLPLAGIKVVEIGQNLAGPYAGEVLATLGADVVKVERPEGDDARGWGPPFWRGTSAIFHTINRNKRSIALDLKDPSAVAWLRDYLAEVDVLVHNLRPGAMAELGLDAESLCARYPRLVYGALSAFGHKGPRRLQLGYEPLVQAFAGIFSVNGAEDGEPARVGVPILDMGTGMWLALGCIAALLRRTQTGRGGTVDASLFETALTWLTVAFSNFQVSGQVPVRHRTGSRRLIVFEAFAATDGEIIIAAANDRLFRKLAVALGRPEWTEDERFTTNAQRLAHKDVLLPEIRAIVAREPSEHWVELLEAAGVPCAPVQDVKHAVAEPQAAALGMIADVPESGLSLIGLPLSFDGERPPMRQRAPELGEHNDELRPAKGKAAE